jgi:hypothetical protein
MKQRVCFCLLAALNALVIALPAHGEESHVLTIDEVNAKRSRAQELTSRAKELRKKAEAVYQEDAIACRKSVLVNNCLTRARDRRLEKVEAARALEMDAGLLESEVRRFDLAERRIKRAKRMEQGNLAATVTVEGAGPLVLTPGDSSGKAVSAEKANTTE